MVLPPATPRPDRLPLDDPSFSWERFESFCLDLISKLPAVRDCHRYGKQGDSQRGIDIFANLDNGERWVFQCKRYKKYNAADTQKAIQTATYTANRYTLLLSCEASSKVRDEVDKHPKWDVWDVHDISLKVRELSPDVARGLIETHFGTAWRREFLGLAGLTTFVSSKDFFRNLLNPNNLFNHLWSLVGRANFVQEFNNFLDSQQRVFILDGRGGIGKTKLLHAFAQEFDNRHQNFVLRFLMEGAPITSDSIDELPTVPCVVVIDDAHRRDDLPALFAVAQQRPQQLKLVLSSRPQGTDHLRSLLAQAGFDSREIISFDRLKELSRDEVKELAGQALGEEYADFANKLAAVSKDCPLITVVGGRLLAEKKVAPQLLERDEEFRNSVLTKFQDVLIGKVSDRIDPQRCSSLLKLIAAVTPVQPESDNFKQTAAEFLGIEEFTLVEDLDVLEESGILLRRGLSLRITPDVLADHILHKACLTKREKPTGYAQQVFEKFKPICQTQVLRNLAELDWRIGKADSEETNLLDDIWQSIWEEFRQASNFERCKLLDTLEQIAYYQPGRSLELVEFAMRNPATTPDNESLARIYPYTHNNVLNKLPEILKIISYIFDYLPRCCELLWQLRKQAGTGVLKEIASYDIYKPLQVNKAVLEAVTRWLKLPNEQDDICSLLDIVDPVLVKSFYSTDIEGHKLSWSSFAISRENTQHIRSQALQLIVDCTKSNQLNVVLRALKSLENALRKPTGSLGREVTPEEEDPWVPEQLRILEIVNGLVAQVTNPLVHLNIIEVLRWHTHYSSSQEVKQKAKNIITSISKSHELRLTGALRDSYNWDWLLEQRKDTTVNYEIRTQRAEEMCFELAKEFLQIHPDPKEGMQSLNLRLQAILSSGVYPCPYTFLEKLSELNPNYSAQICEVLIETPDCPLTPYFYSLLYGLINTDRGRAIAIAQNAVDSENTPLCQGLAGRYLELELTKKLLCHPNFGVRKLAISSLGALKSSEPRLASALALTVNIGSTELASQLCQIFDTEYGIRPDALTDEELGTLLAKIEPITNVEEYHISKFLAYASKRLPRSVIHLLLKRIERDERDHDENYQPLPHIAFHHKLDGLAEREEYEDILRDIREKALNRTHYALFWLPKLFKEASLGFNATSLKVLYEWINSGNAEKIQAVSSLLSDAHQEFVFKHVEFVTNLLEKAYTLGDDCYQKVSCNLRSRSTSGFCPVGQPDPEDIALREQSVVVAEQFPVGSLLHRFYDSLAKDAEASIRDQKLRDEDWLD